MLMMFAGLVLFLGLHSLPMFQNAHAKAKSMMGEVVYKIGYSVLSLVGLILISKGYVAWRYEDIAPILYVPPTALTHIALLLMAVAFVALAATYLPGHIKKTLKHPMLVAVKVWALAHLLANGDLASIVLFGSFLAWAVVDRISLKRRTTLSPVASLEYRPRVLFDVAALIVGLGVYVLFVWKLHLWLIGVSPVSMG